MTAGSIDRKAHTVAYSYNPAQKTVGSLLDRERFWVSEKSAATLARAEKGLGCSPVWDVLGLSHPWKCGSWHCECYGIS